MALFRCGGVNPDGTLDITKNGTYNVEEYASAIADVQPTFKVVQSFSWSNKSASTITITSAITNGLLILTGTKESSGNLYVAASKSSGDVTLTRLVYSMVNYTSASRGAQSVYIITCSAGAELTTWLTNTSESTSGNQTGACVISLLGYDA